MNQKMTHMMEKMFPRLAVMGWVIVLISFLIGVFFLAPAQDAFWSDAKAVREAATAGSALVNANVVIQTTSAWVPSFKFLGLGVGLLAITMALGTIAMKLRVMGQVIIDHMLADLRPELPPIPKAARIFQMSAMIGVLILLAATIVGIVYAVGIVPAYWNHSISGELNPAGMGSTLLIQLGQVASFTKWLDPLRMVGMAFLFSAITVALTVIIKTLRLQSSILAAFYRQITA